jgi:hypothetical protein
MWEPAGYVVVVEPHADDAYLSLHDTMRAWIKTGRVVEIHTVYGGTRHRGNDAVSYATAIGARWSTSGLVEASRGTKVDYEAPTPTLDLPLFSLAADRDTTVVWPLGLRHPEHRAVASLAAAADLRYVEIPYQRVSTNRVELLDALAGREVVSYRWPHASKHDARWRSLFADQATFFHYNPPERLAAPELIVR